MFAPEPRFATQRTPGSRTEGGEVARLARIMGKPMMPWQRTVCDVALELTPAGFYRYPTVMVTVPRQSGKTTLVGPVQLHRIMTRPRIKTFFTAQTGKDGRARMRDLIEFATSSPLGALFAPRFAAGSEGLSVANGSSLNVFAPGPSALHGETPHLVTLDEIWKHDAARGAELLGAIGPAQATLEGESQLWLISTMGTAQSGFMNELVEKGRANHPGMAYFEWSLEDGLDPYEPKNWWTFHPALGNTITQSYLEKEAADQPVGEWMRAYCNRLTSSSDPLVPDEDWRELAQLPLEVPSRRQLAIAYEVEAGDDGDAGGGGAAVMACWRDVDGRPTVRVLHRAPGTSWLIPFVEELVDDWKPAVLAADEGGATKRITDELRRRGREVYTLGAGDYGTACVALLSYIRDRQLKHDGSRSLAVAVAVAVLRPLGESWRFSRRSSAGPIASLIASAVGLWAFDHREQLSKPRIYVPRDDLDLDVWPDFEHTARPTGEDPFRL